MSQTKAQLVSGLNLNPSAPATALQIDASGNINLDSNTLYVDATNNRVGVGTGSPGYLLTVNGRISYSGAIGEGADTTLSSTSTTVILADSATWQNLALKTNGQNRLYINSSGNVGIGTTSPDANSQLHVVGSSYQPLYINTTGTGGGGAAFLRSGTQALYVGTAGGSWLTGSSTADGLIRSEANLIFGIGNSEKARIDSSGRFGIGNSSPSSFNSFANQLVVGTGSGDNGVTIYAGSSSAASISFADGTSGAQSYAGYIHYNHFNDQLGFYVNYAGSSSARMSIDSSGRLLVGTSSSVYSSSLLTVRGGVSTSVGELNLASSVANIASGNDIGAIRITNTNGWRGAQIIATADGTWTEGSSQPTSLSFGTTASGGTNPTERMRLTSTGNLSTLPVNDGILVRTEEGAGTTRYLFAGNRNRTGSEVTTILVWTNGNIQNTNGSYTSLSDQKLKENIVDAGSQWNDLKAIQIRNWNFKEETGYETHRQIGPVAQELEQVCPGLIFETPDRDADGNETGEVTKGVNQSVLYMKAVKALQEAMERIEQLEAEMAEVKTQLQAS